MQANNRDATSLWDMAQAIRRIQEFTQGSSLEDYLASIFMQSAVERQFEILGEAARRISLEFHTVPNKPSKPFQNYAIASVNLSLWLPFEVN